MKTLIQILVPSLVLWVVGLTLSEIMLRKEARLNKERLDKLEKVSDIESMIDVLNNHPGRL